MSRLILPEDGTIQYDSYYVNVKGPVSWDTAKIRIRALLAPMGLSDDILDFICHEANSCQTSRGVVTCSWGDPTPTENGWLFEIDRNIIYDFIDTARMPETAQFKIVARGQSDEFLPEGDLS